MVYSFFLLLRLHGTKELRLLVRSLEATVTELGRGIDELEGDLFQSGALGLSEERLAEGDDSLLHARAGALDHEEVLIEDTVVREATHGGDGLLSQIKLGRGVVGASLADAVDLLVDLGTVMVTVLTGARNGVLDSRRMPSANARDLAETLVSLARKTSDAPTSGDTLETLTLGDGKRVDHLVLLKDRVDGDLLLEETLSVGNLVGNGATVDLDLHDVSLLLAKIELADLGVGDDTDDSAVVSDALNVASDGGLALVVGVLFGVVGESLLLGAVPVLNNEQREQSKE